MHAGHCAARLTRRRETSPAHCNRPSRAVAASRVPFGTFPSTSRAMRPASIRVDPCRSVASMDSKSDQPTRATVVGSSPVTAHHSTRRCGSNGTNGGRKHGNAVPEPFRRQSGAIFSFASSSSAPCVGVCSAPRRSSQLETASLSRVASLVTRPAVDCGAPRARHAQWGS
jgi:hypothetical protein